MQTEGSIIAIRKCRIYHTNVPWNLNTNMKVLEIESFELLGGLGEPLHSAAVEDLNCQYKS